MSFLCVTVNSVPIDQPLAWRAAVLIRWGDMYWHSKKSAGVSAGVSAKEGALLTVCASAVGCVICLTLSSTGHIALDPWRWLRPPCCNMQGSRWYLSARVERQPGRARHNTPKGRHHPSPTTGSECQPTCASSAHQKYTGMQSAVACLLHKHTQQQIRSKKVTGFCSRWFKVPFTKRSISQHKSYQSGSETRSVPPKQNHSSANDETAACRRRQQHMKKWQQPQCLHCHKCLKHSLWMMMYHQQLPYNRSVNPCLHYIVWSLTATRRRRAVLTLKSAVSQPHLQEQCGLVCTSSGTFPLHTGMCWCYSSRDTVPRSQPHMSLETPSSTSFRRFCPAAAVPTRLCHTQAAQ